MNTSKRAVLMIAAIASLMPLGAPGAVAVTYTEQNTTSAGSGLTTAFDRTIELMVQHRVAAEQLSAAGASIAREQLQLQFLSLTAAEQQSVLATARSLDSQEAVIGAMRALKDAVTKGAQQALAEVQAAGQQTSGIQPKLGGDGDLVFVATVGPCRVFDSRFGPGPLGPLAARQIYGFANGAGYPWNLDQGGTGTSGAGNCVGTVYPSTPPVAVVATVAVFNTSSTGSMRAWNGGTTLTVGGILGWNAGDVLSNTTVIPMDRTIAPFPGSGGKRDFGLYNNSGSAIDYVVDVVGYFIENQATALDCQTVGSGIINIPANTSQLIVAPACPTGFTRLIGLPVTFAAGVFTGTLYPGQCRINNTTGGALGVNCDSLCCRIPGR